MNRHNVDNGAHAPVVFSSTYLPDRLPWPVAVIVIAALAAGLWTGIVVLASVLLG